MGEKYAVIYARYSDEKQNESSIDGQIRVCESYAALKGYTIINKYVDRALTGRQHDRPAFLQMIDDSKKGAFEFVIVYQLDRFARNAYDSAVYERRLNLNGVQLLSANENISNDPTGKLLKNVLIGLNEYYSDELAIKVARGMNLSAEKCRHNGGLVPFGYVLDNDNKYVPDPLKAQYVQQIFTKYAKGERLKDIIDWLNNSGIRTSKNVRFTRSSLDSLLKNEKYTGVYTWGKHRIENGVQALISTKLYTEVQSMIKANKKAPARGRDTKYMFTTKLDCGICGAALNGESARSGSGTIYHYYTCYNIRRKQSPCSLKRFEKNRLEDMVYQATVDVISEPGFVENATREIQSAFDKEFGSNDNHVKVLENQLVDLERKLNNLVKAIEQGSCNPVILSKVDEYTAEIKDIRSMVAKEKNNAQGIVFDAKAFEFLIDWMLKGEASQEAHKEKIFKYLVDNIVVTNDYIEIRYAYPDENNKKQPKTVVLSCSSNLDMVVRCSKKANFLATCWIVRIPRNQAIALSV